MAAIDTASCPLNEIHPDYYQIPVEDREALYAEQAAVGAEEPAAAAPPATAGDEADNEAAAATEAGSDPGAGGCARVCRGSNR